MRLEAAAGEADRSAPILLTGATGYVGGRLLRRLEDERQRVRCLTRRPGLLARGRAPTSEIVTGDLLEPESLLPAMKGVRVAYYLVHSMGAGEGFEALDRAAAVNFAAAARDAGVGHIVYLSGLGSGTGLSPHLASRHEVGQILRESGVMTTELRASIVIGAGSASFETVRAVVDRLPAIPAPRGVETAAQPIAITDLVEYLVAALSLAPTGAIFEIGGSDRVTYGEVMREYARQRRLHRATVPLPARTLRASRVLLGILTPEHGRVAAVLAESLHNETFVRDGAARQAFPVIPRGLSAAIAEALTEENREFAETLWDEVLPSPPAPRWGGTPVGRRLVSSRVEHVDARPHEVFAPLQRIGGASGWYAADWFWRLRGWVDKRRGGEGLRRGRRHPYELAVGDAVDFWRVERVEPGRRLLLTAEMRIPGRLWLQFDVQPVDDRTRIRQTTVFDPAGCVGLGYWYLFYPVHHVIFTAMLRGLQTVSQAAASRPPESPLRAVPAPRRSPPSGPTTLCRSSGKDRPAAASSHVDPQAQPSRFTPSRAHEE
jgi:uncharacterized protein YbjT (DUF2867 family)